MTRVLLALHRLGPYHQARLAALPAGLDVAVIETRPASQEYLWPDDPTGPRQRFQLRGAPDPERDPPLPALDRQLAGALRQARPDVVACVGWADPAYLRLLVLCHRQRVPLLIVSDSRERDHARSRFKEWAKAQLLRGFAAAMVAGGESRAYLETLGFPAAAIYQPWDVVDSQFFAAAQPDLLAAAGKRRDFLCVGRFIPEKNHAMLLEAYDRYQRQGGRWGLLLVGGGALEPAIRSQRASLPQPELCQLRPFLAADDLLPCYGSAAALVLPSVKDTWGLVVNEAIAAGLPCLVSTACGCAVDLIDDASTGWSFDPASPEALTALLHAVEGQSPADRQAMVAAARQRLQAFSLESFASGFQAALAHAQRQPRFSRRAAITARLISRL